MPKFSKKTIMTICAIIFVLTFIYVGISTNHKKSQFQKPNPAVTVLTVTEEKHQTRIQAVGTLQASQGAILKAQTDGQVKNIRFNAGDHVSQGDILVELNNAQQKAALDSAVAQETLNKTMYQRDLELKKLGAISLASLDQAKAAMDVGEAALQEAQATYDLTLIRAPFTGRVGISKVSIGDYLQSGSEIVSLQNLNPMFVNFYVPQKYYSDIHLGALVNVKADTAAQSIQGRILNYETVIDNNTGMLQLQASVPNASESLLPGAYATLLMDTGPSNMTMTVPQISISYDTKGAYVYLVKDNVVTQQPVKIGIQIEKNIEILQGLQAGDIIVSAGVNKIKNKDKIQIVAESRDVT